jgi:hypothetical protein
VLNGAVETAANEREVSSRTRWRWPWVAALVVAGVALFLCYARLSETYSLNADGASNSLEAWDMLHGNWLLHGWTLTDVSFYTTELPEYVGVEAVRGLNAGDAHIASAITYTLLVVLAGLLAKGRATGREGWTRALIASGIMLAPQLGVGIMLTLSQPDHVGTQVPLLVVYLILDRAPRRWYVPPLIAMLLTWTIVADTVAVLDAAAPIVAVFALRAVWAMARHREPLAAQRYGLSLAAAGVVATGADLLIQHLIARLGGFRLMPLSSGLTTLAKVPHHLWVTAQGILTLFGADIVGTPPGPQTAIAWLHMIGVALAAAAFLLAFRGFLRSPDPLPALLATALVINVASFVASTLPTIPWNAREVAAVLPFGAVLAGRLLAGPLARARLIPVLGVALACYAAALGYGMSQPRTDNTEMALAGWLEAHHLTTGLGTYTEDNPTTVDSSDRVQLLTVSWQPVGRSVPRWYQSSVDWYDPGTHYANFVVTNTAEGFASRIPRREITATFGKPARVYRYRTFTIMVWHKNLLKDLGTPPNLKPGTIG